MFLPVITIRTLVRAVFCVSVVNMNSQWTWVWTSFVTVRTSIVVYCNKYITVMRNTVKLNILITKRTINAFTTTIITISGNTILAFGLWHCTWSNTLTAVTNQPATLLCVHKNRTINALLSQVLLFLAILLYYFGLCTEGDQCECAGRQPVDVSSSSSVCMKRCP